MTAVYNPARRRKYPPIVRTIGSIAFCDSGVMISLDDIAAALDTDRAFGCKDPTPDEAALMIQGGDNGEPPEDLCARHPALDALFIREMT